MCPPINLRWREGKTFYKRSGETRDLKEQGEKRFVGREKHTSQETRKRAEMDKALRTFPLTNEQEKKAVGKKMLLKRATLRKGVLEKTK